MSGQSLVKNYIHIVFSTKNRAPLILPSIQDELFKYLSGTCNELDCQAIQVGGHIDHVHVLCNLSKKMSLVELVAKLKRHSSMWMKTKGNQFNSFTWQQGYGAFSIQYSSVDLIKNYIKNQEVHHKKYTFQEEFIYLLKEFGIEYNEKYVWG
jgi:REP element-mobilizing transposase RayT